jgi:hypothetical protein
LSYQRSNCSTKFQGVFGLFLWTTGCAHKTINALFCCGLCVSYNAILDLLKHLADHCVTLAINVSKCPHTMCYDNINIKTSIFTEQRGSGTPVKVQSGTFGLLYDLCNANQWHMLIAPIMKHFKNVKPLIFQDIWPSIEQLISIQSQLSIVVIQILTTYSEHFKSYGTILALQPKPCQPMPLGYKTKYYPM